MGPAVDCCSGVAPLRSGMAGQQPSARASPEQRRPRWPRATPASSGASGGRRTSTRWTAAPRTDSSGDSGQDGADP
eukprot:9698916-Alexandrium_andersonii.AAC.1